MTKNKPASSKGSFTNKIKIRIILLTVLSVLWMGMLIFQLIHLQVFNHTRYMDYVEKQNQAIADVTPKRGTIYDRSGNILARSIPKQSLFLQNYQNEPISSQMEKIYKIKNILGLSSDRVSSIKRRIEEKKSFIWIERKIDTEEVEKVNDLGLNGIHFEEENSRYYPNGRLAAHIIGRVDIDDIGASGIEYKYNHVLEGQKGKRLNLKDAKRRQYRFEIIQSPIPGKDIVLTIDETIQFIAEEELEKAVKKLSADWGCVIVSRPDNGEILAIAHNPSFDLNVPPKDISFTDRISAVHFHFDPGSTFKLITAAAALELDKVSLSDTFDCSLGYIQLPGKRITDHKPFQILTFPEVIIHSSNVGAVLIGQKIDEQGMHKIIKAFGLGRQTGIDLPGEETGIFHPLQEWSSLSLPSLSIGYEINVTPIQMLQVVNTISNKGVYATPRIVKKILAPSDQDQIPATIYQKVISEHTASILMELMRKTVEQGTGRNAQIEGYIVAGKTGTAQKLDLKTGLYTSKMHISSFAGCIITDKPIFSIYVVIDSPKGYYYGSDVAAPVFREIAARTLLYLKIPPVSKPPKQIITAAFRSEGEE
jgi:cell division protein FtsI/penicillin-binding protein 2